MYIYIISIHISYIICNIIYIYMDIVNNVIQSGCIV